jgi:hypothetical protein
MAGKIRNEIRDGSDGEWLRRDARRMKRTEGIGVYVWKTDLRTSKWGKRESVEDEQDTG